ncbi:sensor histidine kinase [Actinoplanes sp. GCM10030250]|uniref:sensor histidine kinase n=1 Tax=Actinoplanes sp. GCM10030250 TaxID=3273376 RepID=UPI003620D811
MALAGLASAAMSIALARSDDQLDQPVIQAALFVWIMLLYVGSGLIAWHRRPDSAFGRLLILVGFGAGLSNLSWSGDPLLFTVGQACDLLVVVLFLHVFLAFPTGRLTGPARVIVAAGYAVSVGLQLTVMLLGGFGPDNLLAVADAPAVAAVLHAIELLTLSGLVIAGLIVLAVRRRSGGLPLRRSVRLLVDAFALGLVSLTVLLIMGVFAGTGFAVIQRLTLLILGLAPVAFLLGLLDARLARTSVAGLVLELRASPTDLGPAIARALRDPSARLLYWLPRYRSWVAQDGVPATLPEPGADRAVTMIERGGDPVAALVHHPALTEERDLLDAVAAATEIVLDNERLRAELRAGLAEVRGSRARVLEAGRRERRRLERDLHDGAQQRLIGLSMRLGRLEAQLDGDPAVRKAVTEAKQEVATSLAELRDIARGLYPAVLSGHGLAVALESVAAQATVPVRLKIRLTERPPEPVEVAAYYVICESLTNIGRHARATSASVEVTRTGGTVGTLVAEITDDGTGGADTGGGTGLRGLADRVESLGGTLLIWSPPGGGTRVRAELPCG